MVVPMSQQDLRGAWRHSRQLRSFTAIGIVSTLAYIACDSALTHVLPDAIANAVSQLVTATANTAANRRFTFAGAGNGAAARDHLGGLTAFGVALGLTTVALAGLHLVVPAATQRMELTVLVIVNLVATVIRFFLLRAWIMPAAGSLRHRDKAAPRMTSWRAPSRPPSASS